MRRNGTHGSSQPNSPARSQQTASNGNSTTSSSSASSSEASIANVTNGHDTNGHSSTHSNGQPEAPQNVQRTPTFYGHDREEVTRILIQGLHDLGYKKAADALSDESGFDLETRYASEFRLAILGGDWLRAEALLSDPEDDDEDDDDAAMDEGGGVGLKIGSGRDTSQAQRKLPAARLPLSEDADKSEMLFFIRRQKYLELLEVGLETGNLGGALSVLRQQLQPLHQDERQLHALSSLIMCTSTDELKNEADWDGADGQSRRTLLSELSRSISPSVMIPEHRLANLLTQIKDAQVLNCLYHNTADWPSLYHDHRCEHDQLPLEGVMELEHHTDEVWYLQFSHNGQRLATAGKDSRVYIYDTDRFDMLEVLSDHKEPVAYLSWSPDDTRLITCSQDKTARIWDVQTGTCKGTLDWHQTVVTTAAWTHDSAMFATGSHDADRPLSLWERDSRSPRPVHTFTELNRVQDCAISAPSSASQSSNELDPVHRPARLVAVCVDKSVHVFDLLRREQIAHFTLSSPVTCLNLSTDGAEMLVNLGSDEIWAIDLEDGHTRQRFQGQKQGNFVIRSCFGGASEGFVVSGGEDSKISIWHRHSGTLLEKFSAHHTGCVNAVAWNTAKPFMFASAGDDSVVRVWVSKTGLRNYAYRRNKNRSEEEL